MQVHQHLNEWKSVASLGDRIDSDSKKSNAGFNENAGEHLTKENLKDLL